jgi:hypothetical protein
MLVLLLIFALQLLLLLQRRGMGRGQGGSSQGGRRVEQGGGGTQGQALALVLLRGAGEQALAQRAAAAQHAQGLYACVYVRGTRRVSAAFQKGRRGEGRRRRRWWDL